MKYGNVIFDLDGTLLNTLEDLSQSLNGALREFGFPEVSKERLRLTLGNGSKDFVAQNLPNGREEALFESVLNSYLTNYKAVQDKNTVPYDGVTELLSKLKEKGAELAIVSNKNDNSVKRLSDRFFKDYISCAVGNSDLRARKPAADMLLYSMEELQAEKEDSVYIGDSEVDIQTAKAAGVDCICVAWGYRDVEYLQKHGASFIVHTVSELEGMLF